MNPVAAHPALVPLFFCALALVFVAYGLRAWVQARRFAASASRATGTVVDTTTAWVDPSGSGPIDNTGAWLRFPVVRYQTANGQTVTFRSRTGTQPSPYHVGQQVPVLYNPADPRDARINTFVMTGLLPGCLVAFGAFFFVLGVVILLVMQWARHTLPQ